MVLRSAPAISSSLTTVCCHRVFDVITMHVIQLYVSPDGCSPSKLPKRWARTEDCAADTQVCRTVCHGRFQISAHPGRDPGGRWMVSAHPTCHRCELRKGHPRVDPKRGHRHESSKREMFTGSNAVCQLGHAVQGYAATPLCRRVSAQTHLDQGADVTSGRGGSTVECPDQLCPVD